MRAKVEAPAATTPHKLLAIVLVKFLLDLLGVADWSVPKARVADPPFPLLRYL
jgi:hypothetical protein